MTTSANLVGFNPYEHSVVDVSMRIHGYLCGSGDPIPDDEFTTLVKWLEWRVGIGWYSGLPGWTTFDEAVRRLANAALGAALAHIVEPWGHMFTYTPDQKL